MRDYKAEIRELEEAKNEELQALHGKIAAEEKTVKQYRTECEKAALNEDFAAYTRASKQLSYHADILEGLRGREVAMEAAPAVPEAFYTEAGRELGQASRAAAARMMRTFEKDWQALRDHVAKSAKEIERLRTEGDIYCKKIDKYSDCNGGSARAVKVWIDDCLHLGSYYGVCSELKRL